jgi:hypothetical protein
MRDKLLRERRGSKAWWKISRAIMDKSVGVSSIPALKSAGIFVHDPVAKANALADVFSSKFVVPEAEINEFSVVWPHFEEDGFLIVRPRHMERVLAKLDSESGTGPDGLAVRVLKECAKELALPIAKLVRRIVAQGHWPTDWAVHWRFPLYKRKSTAGQLPCNQLDDSDFKTCRAIFVSVFCSKAGISSILRVAICAPQEARCSRCNLALRIVMGSRTE